ncbi:hypothetical protein EIN_060850 [Entamoeba invadens IP1]|uniref:hypothetical protein n=1 Tax=Entamoeba invadens IP1 TaxID=370355 RepID=UPI0002C3E5EE|nr:hypothetical protein EIN_060850 [Entamoeba invadens IP1]ELP93530.1 hypothetical protein EIN_060850 [Entamoeba invadens IP1]|eukprot:XP_004260301.1 hypothetical protein EIN_060850 [Entamoeba invadens IP1]
MALNVHIQRSHVRVKGKEKIICWSLTKEQQDSNDFNLNFSGLQEDVDDEYLQICLDEYGHVISQLFKQGQRSSLVKFLNEEEVQNVFNNRDRIQDEIGGEDFDIEYHSLKPKLKTNVIVNNIHEDLVDNEDFEQWLNYYGDITRYVLRDVQKGYHTKSLLVNFMNEKDAENFIKDVNGKDVFTCDKPLEAKLCKSPNEMKREKKKKEIPLE